MAKWPNLSPVLVVPRGPVAYDLDVERTADAREERPECVRARPSRLGSHALATPLHRDRPQSPRAGAAVRRHVHGRQVRVGRRGYDGRVVEPQRARVARTRERLVVGDARRAGALAGRNQHVRRVVEPAERLIPEEQGTDLSFGNTAHAAERANRTPDQIQRGRGCRGVEYLSNLTDAKRLGRPVVDVVDPDEAGVERQIRPVAGPLLKRRRHQQPVDGEVRCASHPHELPADVGSHFLAVAARDMTVRQRVVRPALAHEASNRSEAALPLVLAQAGVATAEQRARVERARRRRGQRLVWRRFDDAGRHDAAVRQVQQRRNEVGTQ